MTRTVLALTAVLLALPAAAQAAPQGSTLLQSGLSGLDPFPAGIANDSSMSRSSISADGCKIVFDSMSDGIVAGDNDGYRNVLLRDACAEPPTTTLVSRATGANGAPAANSSYSAVISPNGRYVAFSSIASNLGAPNTGNGVFLRDLQANTTEPVSRATGTTGALAMHQGDLGVSNDGKVVFTTTAKLDDADTNGALDAYVRDQSTTTLVSRNDAGAVGAVMGNTISADGSAVGFITTAKLSSADTNSLADIYVRKGGVTTLVSRRTGADGTAAGYGRSMALNADGSVVVFETLSDIDPRDTNTNGDVYRRAGDVTTLVSRPEGADTQALAHTNSAYPMVDATGNLAGFVAKATGMTPEAPGTGANVFLRDVGAATTRLVSRVAANGAGAGDTDWAALASGGTHVAALTKSNSVLNGDADDFTQVVRHRVLDGAPEHVSRPSGSGTWETAGVNAAVSGRDAVSRDGRYVAFASGSDAIAADDVNASRNAFVRDNTTNTTTQVNLTDADAPATSGGNVTETAISDDGRKVAFVTTERLDPADANDLSDVYVRDLAAGTTTLASRVTGEQAAVAGGYEVRDLSISGDGRRVAFATPGRLVAADSLIGTDDVYVRDLVSGATVLASVTSAGGAAGGSDNPVLDHDGSRVAFETIAELLPDPDVGPYDVYVRDLATNTTMLASRENGPNGAGSVLHSLAPSISADGTRVTFETSATNLSDGGTNGHNHVHLRDLSTGQTVLVSKTADGQQAIGDNRAAVISGDGTRVAFESRAANLGAGGGYAQILVKDLADGSVTRVTRNHGTNTTATRDSSSAAISANGRCVAFLSKAAVTATVPGDFDQVFLSAVGGECPDATAPDTTITEQPDVRIGTPSTDFAFTSTEPGERFECRKDAGEWFACSASAAWDDMAEGAHRFAVRAIDESGNVDATPAEAQFFVDLSTPETSIVSAPSGKVKETTVVVEWSGSDDAFFRCRLDGQPWEDCDPPSKELTGLTDGEHTFEVQAYDYVGHEDATPAKAVFTVDTDGPGVTIASVTATDDGTATATFSSEAGVTFRCAIDGGDFTACTSPLQRTGLAAGEHKVRVQATDEAGNVGAIMERPFTVPAKTVVVEEEPKDTGTKSGGTGGQTTTQPGQQQQQQTQTPTGGRTAQTPAPRMSPAAARAKVLKTTVKRGVAIVSLSCPASAKGGCKGAITVSAKKLGVVARGGYTVAAGKQATLKLKLKGKARTAKRLRLTARAA